MKKMWLRDYDLVAMKENIKSTLAEGGKPDDCIVDIKEIERIKKEIIEHYECYGYEKQNRLLELLEEEFDFKRKDIDSLNSNKAEKGK